LSWKNAIKGVVVCLGSILIPVKIFNAIPSPLFSAAVEPRGKNSQEYWLRYFCGPYKMPLLKALKP
jgi:hypothetical protein